MEALRLACSEIKKVTFALLPEENSWWIMGVWESHFPYFIPFIFEDGFCLAIVDKYSGSGLPLLLRQMALININITFIKNILETIFVIKVI